VSVACRVSVRYINRSTSGFPNALVFCCCSSRKPARWENQTSIYRCWQCTQLKAGPRAYAPTSTARCYAERGIAMASRPSVYLSVYLTVCPSVTLRYRGHIGWNYCKIISRLISLTLLLSADPTSIMDLLQKGTPQILAGIELVMEKLAPM